MQENIKRNTTDNVERSAETDLLYDTAKRKCFDFTTFTDIEIFYQDARKLLDHGFFVVLFGNVKENFSDSSSMLLVFSRNDLKFEQSKKLINSGKYFSFHPSVFNGYNLKIRFKDFGFVEYSIYESLLLVNRERDTINTLFDLIAEESEMAFDHLSSDILISYIELLLQHMSRFYQRFFSDRSDEICSVNRNFEDLLLQAFNLKERSNDKLPTLTYFAQELDLTMRYLNDVSQIVYKQSAQERIDAQIINIAKQLLSNTNLSVAEIAERIGFSQPQSLNRLFKRKTKVTPLEYRISII